MIGLSYQSTNPAEKGARPRWVYAVIIAYGLLLLGLLAVPPILTLSGADRDQVTSAAITVAVLVLSGLSLMIVPVSRVRNRPLRRRTIWIPIAASGLLMAVLVGAAALAWLEYRDGDPQSVESVLLIMLSVWVWWAFVLSILCFNFGILSIGARLHHYLIAGSVLELLVAVPTHLVVRKRTDCCAGIYTGTAICVGLVVMFISLGPSVLLLFWKRVAPTATKLRPPK